MKIRGVNRRKKTNMSGIPSNDAFHVEYMRRKNQSQKKGLISKAFDRVYKRTEVSTDLKNLSDTGNSMKKKFKNFALGVGSALFGEGIESLINVLMDYGRSKEGD